MTTLCAIDPAAKRKHAVAQYQDRVLRVCQMADEDEALVFAAGVDSVVIEMPSRVHAKSTDADIIAVARSAERLGARIYERGGNVAFIDPQTWKGSAQKPKHHRALWSALSPGERIVVADAVGWTPTEVLAYVDQACRALALGTKVKYSSKLKDLLDAVGLGLWAVGRVDAAGNRKGTP